MSTQQKACPVVIRDLDGHIEVLAFRHPHAGLQFVKGTIELGEEPGLAAARELWEESGIDPAFPMEPMGACEIGPDQTPWHFFSHVSSGLPDHWQHETQDDEGHVFDFFWHPLSQPLDESWHPIFHEVYAFLSERLAQT